MKSDKSADEAVIVSLPVRVGKDELTAIHRAVKGPGGEAAVAEGVARKVTARAKATSLIQSRRKIQRALKLDLSADPAWDIVLDLFIKQVDGVSVSVSSACLASSAPMTTSLRYLTALIKRGYIERRASPTDRRVFFVRLSEPTYDKLLSALAEL